MPEVVTARPPSRDDAILDEVVRRLVEACYPDLIYLFGSVARGDAGPDSDYDLLVVVPDDAVREALRAALDAIADLDLYDDLAVRGRSYFYSRLHLRASFTATIVREGKLLYQSANEDISSIMPADKTEDTAEWLRKARADLRRIDRLMAENPPDLEDALYHAQQATEKAMKGWLYWHDIPFHKTHKLEKLGKPIIERNPAWTDLVQRASGLSGYVFLFRYPAAGREPTLEEGQSALALAREVYETLAQSLPEEVR